MSPADWRRPLRIDRDYFLALGLAFGVSVLGYFFLFSAYRCSIVIDGVRYFWLDDDMMISMRYARNLAHGNGLVWNVGERVEGYTNFLWTLFMAVVHVFPVPDATTSLVVRVLSFGLTCLSLFLATVLLRLFVPRSGVGLALAMACIVLCVDVV
jgi:hypothetical protein